VALMGVLNVSPESFYGGSVVTAGDELVRAADAMVRAGAAFVDVGAMSTAPYLDTRVSEDEEGERLASAIARIARRIDVAVSADTSRARPARAALEAGARIINDVTGLTGDPALAGGVARGGAGLIAMAAQRDVHERRAPVDAVAGLLAESLDLAAAAGIAPDAIVVDPGIGFFRHAGLPWHEWDCAILAGLEELRLLGRPVCVGVSRKSFIGAVAGERDPANRLPGSLAAAALAVLGGAAVIRTHDVAETRQAVQVAQAVRRARRSPDTTEGDGPPGFE
jgi:dihydropteroate synthase